jgi:hypothetical protein
MQRHRWQTRQGRFAILIGVVVVIAAVIGSASESGSSLLIAALATVVFGVIAVALTRSN